MKKLIIGIDKVGLKDVPLVGGKNASLGEMLRHLGPKGIPIPNGFITTADAYRYFLSSTGLDVFIRRTLRGLDTQNIYDLKECGRKIRHAIITTPFPAELENAIRQAYRAMEKKYGRNTDVAVRSSATAEDLPGASFAGQHETYLGIKGIDDILVAIRSSMASLFTDRAISYRVDKGFKHVDVALSVAVQMMVRADLGVSGVLFTLDTESGFKDTVLINSAWGLGEMVVQGKVNPDEYVVAKKFLDRASLPIISKVLGSKDRKMIYAAGKGGIRPVKIVTTSASERAKFTLSDKEILLLAKWGIEIEKHYTKRYGKWTPMDIEWAKDGKTQKLFILQARPETIHAERDFSKIKEYTRSGDGKILVRGVSVGSKITVGRARVIFDVKDIHKFQAGEVLVTDMTDPDWEPIMKIASAIVTDEGGRTSHAAIVSRELGIPAVVGAGNATSRIKTGSMVTVDTVGSDGLVLEGALKFSVRERDLRRIPKTRTKIMMNIGTPETAFEKSFLPNRGVGLAREEFIIASEIGIHPMALIHYRTLPAPLKKKIDIRTVGWPDKKQFYIDHLAYGIARIGTAFYPHPVIVRFSDFKTNEYRTLLGGDLYEPIEQNPMIGWRGASRYYHSGFREAFKLECAALKMAREKIGLTNLVPMVPFCRTPEEGIKTLKLMREAGLKPKYLSKGKDSMPVYVMCEIPSNIINADKFLDIFDGMSIGSNDLAQLILGLDRDSEIVSRVGNEMDPAVMSAVADVIQKCRKRHKYIGICGQAPSDYPDFAKFLVSEGIESMSLIPDTVVETTIAVAKQEKRKKHG
ncbi:MAG: phosphoenolpyruvate synthase [Candidatus Colwellbacteria bacterium]|nr:phosphoenolpyruvate synthase [Candidatus Colwellbacteria bacterium]